MKFPRWARPLFDPARYKSVRGGRGGAKSWTVATVLLALAASRPLRVLCTREYQNSIRDSVHRLLWDRINEHGLPFIVLEREIRHRNGSLFLFEGTHHNVEKIKSTEGVDVCWVEEAQTMSERSWEILIPTIRKSASEIILTWNPDQDTDPTYQRFVVNPPPGLVDIDVGLEHNPWKTPELIAERDYLYRVDPEAAEHVWGGKTRRVTDAQVLRGRYRVESFEPAPEWHGPYYGADWGFSVDPTTLVRCWVSGRTLYVEYEAYGVGVDIEDTPKLFDAVPGAKKHTIRADSARPETISHMRRHGYPQMLGVSKRQGSVEDGVEHLRSYEQIVIHPRCKHTAEEARLWSYKTDKLTGDVLPALLDKHDHCLAGDTIVDTADGPRRIDSLIGQSGEVASYTDAGVVRGQFRHVRMTSPAELVYRVTLADGRSITATGEHMFLTADGWRPLLGLAAGSCLVDVSAVRYADEICTQNTNGSTARNSHAMSAPVTTSIAPDAHGCIGGCGQDFAAPSQQASISITSTTTDPTMPSRTSRRLAAASINDGIGARTGQSEPSACARIYREQQPQLQDGIEAPLGGNGTASTAGAWPQQGNQSQQCASTAQPPTRASSRDDFARTLASLLRVAPRSEITFQENALCVTADLRPIDTAELQPAAHIAGQCLVSVIAIEPAGMAPVYNLEADDHHTFTVAGGIVTHNCWDAIRYALEPIIRAGRPGAPPPKPAPKKPDYRPKDEGGAEAWKTV